METTDESIHLVLSPVNERTALLLEQKLAQLQMNPEHREPFPRIDDYHVNHDNRSVDHLHSDVENDADEDDGDDNDTATINYQRRYHPMVYVLHEMGFRQDDDYLYNMIQLTGGNMDQLIQLLKFPIRRTTV